MTGPETEKMAYRPMEDLGDGRWVDVDPETLAAAKLTTPATDPVPNPLVGDEVEAVSAQMLKAAMRAFEPLSSVLRYREKDGWHACDQMAMRAAISAALSVRNTERSNVGR